MSKTIYEFKPDWLHLAPPGDSIIEDLEYRSLSQAEFAQRMDYSTKHIYKLIKGEVSITVDTALRLEKVLSYPASFWLNAESNYRKALAKEAEKKIYNENQDWLKKIPLKNMIDYGWIKKFTDKGEQVSECLKFYGSSSIDAWHNQKQSFQTAFKSYEKFDMDNIAIQTWLRAGENGAVKIVCQPFDKKKLVANLATLRNLTTLDNPKDFEPKLKAICADSGIAVVFEPTPKKCPMSGATKWLSSDKALLLLSLRHKTNDHLWFAFFHEIAHILKHKKQLFLEDGGKKFVKDMSLENEADKFASDLLIPSKYSDKFNELQTPIKIKYFAKEMGIASGIVVGRLQHEKIINFSYCNELKIKYQWNQDVEV